MITGINQISAKQGRRFFAASFVVLFFGNISVFAAAPIPVPVCRIEGVIKSVEFKNVYSEACLKEPDGCPTDGEFDHPARYFIDVNVNSVSYVNGDTRSYTCQNLYPVGKVRKTFINKDKVKSGDTFSVNQKIDGIISGIVGSFREEVYGVSFDSYILGGTPQPQPVTPPGNENVGPTIKSSSEVSIMLVEQEQLNAVDGIELSSDEQQYTVKGYRSAKLLFFIPVSVKVELKINAVNGNIEQVKKSWWAFLVR